jgi:hypothetical protein
MILSSLLKLTPLFKWRKAGVAVNATIKIIMINGLVVPAATKDVASARIY